MTREDFSRHEQLPLEQSTISVLLKNLFLSMVPNTYFNRCCSSRAFLRLAEQDQRISRHGAFSKMVNSSNSIYSRTHRQCQVEPCQICAGLLHLDKSISRNFRLRLIC